VYDVGRYCVYLLAAGGGIAYAGSSGRVEERLRRRSRGYFSAAARGLRPGAAYVLACTRSRSLAPAREAWLHKAHQPPYAARAPAERPRKPPTHPRVVHPTTRSVSLPCPPPCGMIPPPSPAAEAQTQSQDVGRGERRRLQLARPQSPSEGSI
jgi:predicted GIY-YIG superfamily endonuclease